MIQLETSGSPIDSSLEPSQDFGNLGQSLVAAVAIIGGALFARPIQEEEKKHEYSHEKGDSSTKAEEIFNKTFPKTDASTQTPTHSLISPFFAPGNDLGTAPWKLLEEKELISYQIPSFLDKPLPELHSQGCLKMDFQHSNGELAANAYFIAAQDKQSNVLLNMPELNISTMMKLEKHFSQQHPCYYFLNGQPLSGPPSPCKKLPIKSHYQLPSTQLSAEGLQKAFKHISALNLAKMRYDKQNQHLLQLKSPDGTVLADVLIKKVHRGKQVNFQLVVDLLSLQGLSAHALKQTLNFHPPKKILSVNWKLKDHFIKG